MKEIKNAMMGNWWKSEISRAILNIFRLYNGIDIFKLPFLDELYEKTFVVPHVNIKHKTRNCKKHFIQMFWFTFNKNFLFLVQN